MIVFPDGKKMGTVGGGAIEYIALQENTKKSLQTKKSISIKYSLNKDRKDFRRKRDRNDLWRRSYTFF